MSTKYVIYQPKSEGDVDLKDIFIELESEWDDEKARKLQDRRWRKIRRSENRFSVPFHRYRKYS